MTNEILGRLKGPAIGLIVTGVLNFVLGVYFIASSVFQYFNGAFNRDFISDAERTGFYIGFWGLSLCGFIGMIIAPVIIFGAVKMMKGKSYGFAKATAILAIIPLTSCCFIAGMPFGIWALVVLRNPDVISFFNGEPPSRNFNSPNNW